MTLKFNLHSSLLGLSNGLAFTVFQSKKQGKDHESIQSDPGHNMGKNKSASKHHTQKSQKIGPFPTGDYNAVIN